MNDPVANLLQRLSEEAGFEITEAELLHFVEEGSVRTPPARLDAVMGRSPRISSLVTTLRADRTSLSSMPAAKAPASLLDGIQVRLERDALLADQEAEAAPSPIPISRVEIRRPSIWDRLAERTPWRQLAVAAGILAAFGIGAWGINKGLSSFPGSPKTLAHNGNASDQPAGETNTGSTPSETTIAALPKPAHNEPSPTTSTNTTIAAAVTAENPSDTSAISETEAIRLAAQNRLAIVISADGADAARRLGSLIASAPTDRTVTWTEYAADRLPEAYAALATPSTDDPMETSTTGRPTLLRPFIAGDRTNELDPLLDPSLVGPMPPAATPSGTPTVIAVYTAEFGSADRDLASVIHALRARPGLTLRFRELDAPIETPLKLDAESVLWWVGAPSKWTRTTTVPVVVETTK